MQPEFWQEKSSWTLLPVRKYLTPIFNCYPLLENLPPTTQAHDIIQPDSQQPCKTHSSLWSTATPWTSTYISAATATPLSCRSPSIYQSPSNIHYQTYQIWALSMSQPVTKVILENSRSWTFVLLQQSVVSQGSPWDHVSSWDLRLHVLRKQLQ